MIVAFRGRRTAAILHDAHRAGLYDDDDEIVVVCRRDDRLREPADVEAHDLDTWSECDDMVIIANGGTTAQLVPVLIATVREHALYHTSRYTQDLPTWRLRVVDVQPDAVVSLYDSDAKVQATEKGKDHEVQDWE